MLYRKNKSLRYVGDITYNDLSSPRRRKSCFNIFNAKVLCQKRKINSLMKKIYRQAKQISNLRNKLNIMEENKMQVQIEFSLVVIAGLDFFIILF